MIPLTYKLAYGGKDCQLIRFDAISDRDFPRTFRSGFEPFSREWSHRQAVSLLRNRGPILPVFLP